MPRSDPFESFVHAQGVAVLDGGLATALEAAGEDLNDPLWSAKVLLDAPHAVHGVHRAFLDAGADCISSATYQATLAGFQSRGLVRADALALIETGVRIAVEARDGFWSEASDDDTRLRPLVAASLGPYGAYLADGSEYVGDYALDVEALCRFHEPQWSVLTKSGADVVACETIPSGVEVTALLRLVERTPGVAAWISLSCRDGETLADGTPVEEVARACDRVAGVVGVGVNCVPPTRVTALLRAVGRGTGKRRVVYPNSGEHYDPADKSWGSKDDPVDWVSLASEWRNEGAQLIGGCCRTTSDDVARLRRSLLASDA